ncbi:MAG TPA: glycosyltransferase [Thermotogota bacterium]|nr:glycosyltransferase [Thermotogota bacterium]
MKILYLTGSISSPDNFSALPFIKKRVEALYSYGYITQNISIVGVYSKILSSLVRTKYKKYKRVAPKDWNPKFTQNGIEYEVIPYDISLLNFYKVYPNAQTAYELLRKRVDLSRFDLVHAHWSFPEGVIANRISKEYNIPYVMTCHGYDIKVLPNKNKRLKEEILKSLDESSGCIFVSNALLEEAKKLGYTGNNSYLIPNGYDPHIFRYVEKPSIRQRLNIYHEGYHYVGYVGNLVKEKGADRLPAIFHEISNSLKTVIFIIVGNGYETENIKKMTESLSIIYTGRVKYEEVAQYMQSMDIIILPSRREGWPCVIKEAQACGTPVIGSNVGGIPEAVGEVGRVVDEGVDFEKRFAEAVVRELTLKSLTDEVLRSAEGYTWREIVLNEIRLYESIVK